MQDNSTAASAKQRRVRIRLTAPAVDYKRRAEQEIAYRKAKGDDISDILPHPDSVEVNPRTGDVTIKGPIDKDEQALVNQLKAYRQDIIDERNQDISAQRDTAWADIMIDQINGWLKGWE